MSPRRLAAIVAGATMCIVGLVAALANARGGSDPQVFVAAALLAGFGILVALKANRPPRA